MDARWFAWLAFAALLAIPLFAWAKIGEDLLRMLTAGRHSAGVARRARAQGWQWSSEADVSLRSGLPFEFGGETWCRDVVRGEIHGQSFVAFTYRRALQVYSVPLRGGLPYLEVKVRGLTDRGPLHAEAIGVESDAFNQRFVVAAHDRRFASRVLSPRVMQRLLDERALSWRISGNELIGWRSGELQGRVITPSVELLLAVRDAVPEYVWSEDGTVDHDVFVSGGVLFCQDSCCVRPG